MFGSEILDVAIGLVLVFLSLSLICSSIREALETVFKHRAKDLERGIREMFGDIGRDKLVPDFYQHPLINGLFQGPYTKNKTTNLPSYIPPQTFALVVIDLVKTASQAENVAPEVTVAALSAGQAAISSAAELKRAVLELPPNSTLRGALLPLIDAAGDDVTRIRKNIEDWYNASMDRVSGWYKRRTQIVIAVVGFAIAAVMNVDAVGITRYLNTNQTARSVIIAQAEATAHRPLTASPGSADPMGFLERQGGVPFGWVFTPEPDQPAADFQRDWRRAPVTINGWLLKIAGILFTGFAVSLGAPFWFDVLNRFMVIRSTVKPEEKSPEEKSKD